MMNRDQIEGKGDGLHYRALRLLQDRLDLRGTPPSECADKGQFGEEQSRLTDDEFATIDGARDKLAGFAQGYAVDHPMKNVHG